VTENQKYHKNCTKVSQYLKNKQNSKAKYKQAENNKKLVEMDRQLR